MIISYVEQVEKSFGALMSDLEFLRDQLHNNDWNTEFLEIVDNKIEEITTILAEQKSIVEDLGTDIINYENGPEELPLSYCDDDEMESPLDEPMDLDQYIQEEDSDTEEWED